MYSSSLTLQMTFWSTAKDRLLSVKDSVILENTIRIWDRWRNRLMPSQSLLLPIASQLNGFPSLPKIVMLKLQEANINVIAELFQRGKLMDDLKAHIGLPLPWYLYLQLNSFINSKLVEEANSRHKTDFERLLQSTAGKTRHLLSMIYRILVVSLHSDSYKECLKWNSLLDAALSNEQWQQVWTSLTCTSIVNAT